MRALEGVITDELLDYVARDPTNLDALSVYADAMESQGDPRASYLRARVGWDEVTPLDPRDDAARRAVEMTRNGLDASWLREVGDPWLVHVPRLTHLPADRGARWRALDRFTRSWGLRTRHGSASDTLETVAQAELQLGLSLPPAVVEWLTLPYATDLDGISQDGHHSLPHDLAVSHFAVENQGTARALRVTEDGLLVPAGTVVLLDDLGVPDPPVYRTGPDLYTGAVRDLRPYRLLVEGQEVACPLSAYAWSRRLFGLGFRLDLVATTLPPGEGWEAEVFEALQTDFVPAMWQADTFIGRLQLYERRDLLVMVYDEHEEIHVAARSQEVLGDLPPALREAVRPYIG